MIDVCNILDSKIPEQGKKIALIYDNRSFTYQELFDEVLHLACGLLQNFNPGELLAIWLPNSPEILCIYLACLKTGVVPMPLHQEMKWTEVRKILDYTQVKTLITSRKIIDSLVLDCTNTSLNRIYVIGSGDQALPYHAYSELTNNQAVFANTRFSADLPGFVLHTSGSEGYPKGVMLSYRNLNHILKYRLTYTKLTCESVSVVASCLTQSVGLHQSLALLAAGGMIVLLESYNIDQMVTCIHQYQPTHLIMVVNAFERLLHHPGITKNSFKKISFAAVGADRVTTRVQNRFLELTGKPLNVSYGMTESSWALVNIDGRLDKCMALGKPGPDIEIKLSNPQGNKVAIGEVGEIFIKSPRTMLGYLYNEPLTKAAFVNGWLASGDLAYQDDEGYFWFAGRKKNIIVLNTGDNVSPVEVEQIILSHPAVSSCVVVGAMAPDHSDVPWAFVARLDETLSEMALEAFLKEKISTYKIPRKIIFVTEIPVGLTGKVQHTH